MNVRPHGRGVRGFTLIELMVALVLGLVVSGAALAVFMTNRQTYAATESLGRVQENARTGFELMARDLRQASATDCGRPSESGLNVTDQLNTNTNWYTNWNNGIAGYEGDEAMTGRGFGTTYGSRTSNTDAIELHGAMDSDDVPIVPPTASTLDITVRDASGFSVGDVVVACDPAQMNIFQITGKTGDAIARASGTTPAPGNVTPTYYFGCDQGLYTECSAGSTWSATLAKLHSVRWYIGPNDHGNRSLFRDSMTNDGGTLKVRTDEIAEGVQDLQLRYLVEDANDYVDADAVSASTWSNGRVVAVRVDMTINDSEKSGTNQQTISRVLEHTITFRNRVE